MSSAIRLSSRRTVRWRRLLHLFGGTASEIADKTIFGERLDLKGIRTRFLDQTIFRSRRQVNEPGELCEYVLPLCNWNHDA